MGTRSNISWPRCGVASLVGATLYPCSEPSGVYFGELTNCSVFVYGSINSYTTDSLINWGS